MTKTSNKRWMFITDIFQQTGMVHFQNHQESQDTILTRESDTIEILGLADGQGSKKLCTIGGYEVLNHVADYVETTGIERMITYPYIDELVFEVVMIIRRCLQNLAELNQEDVEQFSSTMVLFAVDKCTGNFVTMHLGDGIILGIHDNSIIYVSQPENGITSQYTWLTTSRNALNHLRIGFGNIKDYSRILIISDGATSLCCGKRITHRARELILSGKRNEVVKLMSQSHSEDDATLIISDIMKIE